MSYKEITSWKQRWGTIHQIVLEGITCYYRSLTAWEFTALKELMDHNPSVDWDSVICSMGLLGSDVSQFKLAGTTTTMSSLILEASIFTEETIGPSVIEAREWAAKVVEDNFLIGLALAIGSIYPGSDIISLLNEPAERLIKLGALVEQITKQPIFKDSSGLKAMPLTKTGEMAAQNKGKQIAESTRALREEISKQRKKK